MLLVIGLALRLHNVSLMERSVGNPKVGLRLPFLQSLSFLPINIILYRSRIRMECKTTSLSLPIDSITSITS